jgi:hypothetical protein
MLNAEQQRPFSLAEPAGAAEKKKILDSGTRFRESGSWFLIPVS